MEREIESPSLSSTSLQTVNSKKMFVSWDNGFKGEEDFLVHIKNIRKEGVKTILLRFNLCVCISCWHKNDFQVDWANDFANYSLILEHTLYWKPFLDNG